MPRYIDADKLRDEVDDTLNWETNNEYNMYSDVMYMIDNCPTEDVQFVVHAKWVFVSLFHDEEIYRCSNCHEPSCEEFPYCPSCGAKMDKEVKS